MHRLAEVWRRGGDGRSGSKTINESGHKTGGEAGIRTLDRAFRPYNGLANRRLQPLGHLTAARNLSIRQASTYAEPSCPHFVPEIVPASSQKDAFNGGDCAGALRGMQRFFSIVINAANLWTEGLLLHELRSTFVDSKKSDDEELTQQPAVARRLARRRSPTRDAREDGDDESKACPVATYLQDHPPQHVLPSQSPMRLDGFPQRIACCDRHTNPALRGWRRALRLGEASGGSHRGGSRGRSAAAHLPRPA
jgi:hypothetical protein